MTNDTHIVRRPDGSIDSAYYLALGRRERSRQAIHLARSAAQAVGDAKRRALPKRDELPTGVSVAYAATT